MSDTIRSEVVSIGWEIEDSPFAEIEKQLQEIVKFANSFVNNVADEFVKLAQEANVATDDFTKLKDEVKRIADEAKKTGDNDGIPKVGDEAEKSTKSAKKLSEKLKEIAKTSFTKVVSGLKSIGSVAMKGLKVVGVGLAAGATAIGALVTKSVQTYADYEQLVGGVDTLFKDNSKAVQKYANDAYKTAGLSANEYMNTVTGFSASLLQSLGGDTKKAADLSNQAIIDMSDNANKMGTDMGMIQNAYQGFAKQNYTMLDNLKLGYGGTKEEMQRLLTDAGKLANQKFDISSYADVIQAIHVIQENMDITGTTAKEASETISGSFASMRSAWQNLLPALVQGGDSFDQCVKNLVESIKTFAGNVMPAVKSALTGVASLIQQLAPIIAAEIPGLIQNVLPPIISAVETIGQSLISAVPTLLPILLSGVTQLFNSLIQMIQSNLPQLSNTAVQIILSLVQFILQALPQLVSIGGQMLMSLISGITQQLPQLLVMAVQVILTICQGIINNLPQILIAAIQIIISLVQGIFQSLPLVIQAAIQMVGSLARGIVDNLPMIVQVAYQLLTTLVIGLIQAIPQLISAAYDICKAITDVILQTNWLALGWEIIKSLGKGIWDGITSLFSSGKQAGEQTANGVSSGITSGAYSVNSAASGLATGAANSFNMGSTTTTYGYNVTSGFASGMSSGAGNISATTQGTQDEVMNGFKMDLYNQGNTTMTTYNGGLTGTAPVVNSTVQGISTDVQNTMSDTNLYDSGVSVMQGFRDGMESQRSAIIGTAKDIASSVKSTIDSSLKIHSPSKVTEQSGINTARGMIKGVAETLPEVEKSSETLANTYKPETDRGIIRNNNTTSNDTYAPSFNLTINNNGNDREMEFKVKQWIREGMEDMARGLSRRNPKLREV